MRAVADTNAVVSGLLWTGAPRALLIAARAGRLSLYTSATLLGELSELLTRAKLTKRVTASNMSVERLVRRYAQFVQRVIPASIDPVILADPDDDQVIACAIAALEMIDRQVADAVRSKLHEIYRVVVHKVRSSQFKHTLAQPMTSSNSATT